LLRMINDLLDLARFESGQMRQRLEIVSPKVLVENILPDLRLLVEANDGSLIANIAPDLANVSVDTRQIGHVFSNFVSNAARFSKPGDEVQLLVKAVGNAIRFSVVDHGPGIPKEFQSRIFERFFRIPGADQVAGVGLGLAIAKEIVASHGGVVGLNSVPGEGSEFFFELPSVKSAVNGAKP